MKAVFYSLCGGGLDRKVAAPAVLANALHRKAGRPPVLHPAVKTVFLDSGGFTVQGRYPHSPAEYADLVQAWVDREPRIRYAAVQDLPGDLQATTRLARACLQEEIGPAEWVAVVQGGTVDEYRACCETFTREGLWTPTTAIGGVARAPLARIRAVARTVRAAAPPGTRLHIFGMGLRGLQDREIWATADSCDTGAWKFNLARTPGFRPGSHREKLQNLEAYRVRVAAIFQGMNQQTRLIPDFPF